MYRQIKLKNGQTEVQILYFFEWEKYVEVQVIKIVCPNTTITTMMHTQIFSVFLAIINCQLFVIGQR